MSLRKLLQGCLLVCRVFSSTDLANIMIPGSWGTIEPTYAMTGQSGCASIQPCHSLYYGTLPRPFPKGPLHLQGMGSLGGGRVPENGLWFLFSVVWHLISVEQPPTKTCRGFTGPCTDQPASRSFENGHPLSQWLEGVNMRSHSLEFAASNVSRERERKIQISSEAVRTVYGRVSK